MRKEEKERDFCHKATQQVFSSVKMPELFSKLFKAKYHPQRKPNSLFYQVLPMAKSQWRFRLYWIICRVKISLKSSNITVMKRTWKVRLKNRLYFNNRRCTFCKCSNRQNDLAFRFGIFSPIILCRYCLLLFWNLFSSFVHNNVLLLQGSRPL